MIKIQNIYYMLAYAFQELREDGYAQVATEEFDHFADLCAAILAKGIAKQIKRGLGREYIRHSDPLHSPRGKINVSASLKQLTVIHKQLVCEFDEYTENTYMNQILKSTALLLIRSGDVRVEQKRALKKIMPYFNAVDTINPKAISWSHLRYHRNNATYKMLMNICYLIIDGLLLTTQDGPRKLAAYLDDQRMNRLYEKFVLEYFRRHYPHFGAAASHVDWHVDDGVATFLPAMKTDITLQYNGKTLIIDTKYYGRTMQTNSMYDTRTMHSHNMYQIFTYVKNKDTTQSGKVSGLLLYAKTDEEIVPDNDYKISGNRISVKTLDLNTDFTAIKKQLNAFVEDLMR